MTWSLRWRVVERPPHLDPRLPSPEGTVSQGEVVEFQLVSSLREESVRGRDPGQWDPAPGLTVTDSRTVGPFPPASSASALLFRYRFAWAGHKRIRIAGRLRRADAEPVTGARAATAARPVVAYDRVELAMELDVIADPLSERGRIAATAGRGGREERALAAADRGAESGRLALRESATERSERLARLRRVRASRLRRRRRELERTGVVPWPFLDEAGLRALTDDEVSAYLLGLGTMADPEVTPVLDLRPASGHVRVEGQPLPFAVTWISRVEEVGGEIRVWQQPSRADLRAADGGPLRQNERRYVPGDLLSVRYASGPPGLVPARELAAEVQRRALEAFAWQVVEFVIMEVAFRLLAPPLWAGLELLRMAAGRLGTAASRLAARATEGLLERAVALELRLAERESAVLLRAAEEARATGRPVVSEATEAELAELARSRGLLEEPAAAARGTGTPVRPRAPSPAAEAPALATAGAGASGGRAAAAPAVLGDGVLLRNLEEELLAALDYIERSPAALRRASPVRRGIMMEGVALRLLRRRVIEPLRHLHAWQTGRLTRYTAAIHELRTSGFGQDLYGFGRQVREAAEQGWAAAGERAAGSGSLSERFSLEQSRYAQLTAPFAAELKTGSEVQRLGEFGSGWQMDLNYLTDRWIRWSQGPGEATVRQLIRERRLHPYWAHPEWVQGSAFAEYVRGAFTRNRVVIVFSRHGNIGIANRTAAGLTEDQVLRVAVPYLE